MAVSFNAIPADKELARSRGEENAEDLLTRCEQEGRAFSRLVINAIN